MHRTSRDEKIKKGLSLITDDFAQEDIEFIKEIVYPTKVEMYIIDDMTNEKIVKRSESLEDLDELINVFKTVDEECIIEIKSLTGKMKIKSREER